MTASDASRSTPKPNFEYIDSLRGLAIAAVVLVHATGGQAKSSTLLQVVCGHGAMGVQLFFVASAVTLMYSETYRHRRSGEADWKGFFLRRFFRIAPLFWLAAIFYAWLHGRGGNYWCPNGIEWWFYPITFLFQHGWTPQTINSVVPGGWSIAAEMNFYLLFPLLFRYVDSLDRSLLLVLTTVSLAFIADRLLVGLFGTYEPTYLAIQFRKLWFVAQLPVFAIGILTYHVMHSSPAPNRARGTILLAIALLVFAASLQSATTLSIIQEHTLFSLGFCLLALALQFHPNRVLVNRLTRNLGILSFSIYINHFAIIWILSHKTAFYRSLPDGIVGVSLGFSIVLCLAIATSAATHRFIEKSGIELGRVLDQKFSTVS